MAEELKENKEWKDEVFRYGQLGTEFVASVIIGLVLGYLFDLLFSTSPWGFIGGLILGIAAAFWQIFKFIIDEESKEPDPKTIRERIKKKADEKAEGPEEKDPFFD